MKLAGAVLISGLAWVQGVSAQEEDVVRLSSGRIVPLERGRVGSGVATALLAEAEGFMGDGRLDLALEECEALIGRAEPKAAAEALALVARIEDVERSTVITLKDGRSFRGRLRTALRSDRLGLQAREEVPLGRIEQLAADYVINYSQVTSTFYLMTLLDIRFRDAPPAVTTLTEEIMIELEESNGTVRRFPLGCPYELLRKEEMGNKIPGLIKGRVSRVIVYSDLPDRDVGKPGASR